MYVRMYTYTHTYTHTHSQAPPILEEPQREARRFSTNEAEEVTFLESLHFVSAKKQN